MTRAYQVPGETMVWVGDNSAINDFEELGLSMDMIRIIPRFIHRDLLYDDWGMIIPADVLWYLAECRIMMNLVHYDQEILSVCIRESMGGRAAIDVDDGTCGPAGQPLGAGKAMGDTKNHLMALFLECKTGQVWRFPSAYLTGDPLEIPIGTEKTVVQLNWRAIPYKPLPTRSSLSSSFPDRGAISSRGAIVYDHVSIFS